MDNKEEHMDDTILRSIQDSFKTVREISSELGISYLRVSVRMNYLRKRREVIMVHSSDPRVRGVRPVRYKKKDSI